MTDYIEREALLLDCTRRYCEDCDRRKGMKNGKMKTVYAIGDAPCRACWVDDMMGDIEDFPAADVKPVVRGEWKPRDLTFGRSYYYCSSCEMTVDMPTAMFVPLYRFCPYCMSDNKKEDEG